MKPDRLESRVLRRNLPGLPAWRNRDRVRNAEFGHRKLHRDRSVWCSRLEVVGRRNAVSSIVEGCCKGRLRIGGGLGDLDFAYAHVRKGDAMPRRALVAEQIKTGPTVHPAAANLGCSLEPAKVAADASHERRGSRDFEADLCPDRQDAQAGEISARPIGTRALGEKGKSVVSNSEGKDGGGTCGAVGKTHHQRRVSRIPSLGEPDSAFEIEVWNDGSTGIGFFFLAEARHGNTGDQEWRAREQKGALQAK